MKHLCRVIRWCVLGTSLWAIGATDEDRTKDLPVKLVVETPRPEKRKEPVERDDERGLPEEDQKAKKPKIVRFRSKLLDPTPPAQRGVEGDASKVALKSILKNPLVEVSTEEEEVSTDEELDSADTEEVSSPIEVKNLHA